MGSIWDAARHVDGGVTHLVTVASGVPCDFFGPTPCLALDVRDEDDFDLQEPVAQVIDFVSSALEENADAKILFHCMHGRSRSATVMAAVLMLTQAMRRPEVMELLRVARPQVRPNDGFIAFLDEFEDFLVERGTITTSVSPEEAAAERAEAAAAAKLDADEVDPDERDASHMFDAEAAEDAFWDDDDDADAAADDDDDAFWDED